MLHLSLARLFASLAALSAAVVLLAACATEPEPTGPDRSVADSGDDARVFRDASSGETGSDVSNDATALPDAGADTEAEAGSEGGSDADIDDAGGGGGADVVVDVVADVPPIDDECDLDGDGYAATSCGGDDCNDDDPRINPGAIERCNFDDDNCNGTLNDGVECLIYAHSSSQLYAIDPFRFESRALGSVPGLFDFDTSSDGTLWGISSSQLYRYNGSSWNGVGSLDVGLTANGFAIDSRDNAWATGGNTLYSVDLTTGRATEVGDMGGGFISSGDCVVNKSDSIYMSSSPNGGSGDGLILIDGRTGVGTEIGRTGFSNIYGLTAAWGYMFGFTSLGQVVSIDVATGRGTLLHTFRDIVFYGAASGTDR